MKNILVVVDMQHDFVSGSLGSDMAKAIVANVAKKIEHYNSLHSLVIATLDTHGENYLSSFEGTYLPVEHCIKGKTGHKICSDVLNVLNKDALYVEKDSFASLKLPLLIKDYLKDNNIEEKDVQIELVGLCTDICVVSNALLLRSSFPNTHITVDSACCAGTTAEKHLATLEVLKSCQIEVI